jgi:hypothetical protein
MDRGQMSFFPENVQKDIYERLEKAFHRDTPYPMHIIEKIKDKFHEWDQYKLETVGDIVRHQHFEKKKN